MELSYLFKYLKKNNIFGDYILATRPFNNTYDSDLYQDASILIMDTITWKYSPQGYRFWNYYYNHYCSLQTSN